MCRFTLDDLTIGGTTADPHSTTAAAAISNDATSTRAATSTAETSVRPLSLPLQCSFRVLKKKPYSLTFQFLRLQTTETDGVVSTSSSKTETNSKEVISRLSVCLSRELKFQRI